MIHWILWSARSLAELTKRTVLDLFASRHEAQSCFPCCVLFGGEPAEDTAFSDGSDRGRRAHSRRVGLDAQSFANTPRAMTKTSRLLPEILDVLAFDVQSSPTSCRP